MVSPITVSLNSTNTEIEIYTYPGYLSREENNQLAKVCWDYHWNVEGTFKVETDGEGGVVWTFFFYIMDHGIYSEGYCKEDVEQVRNELIDLITKALPSKSVKCIGFD